ncbi:helix-turn-helix domain-containing protein [Enterococcus ratti]|uniref:helix-turn-helix domain-containing protein n=1 Tax=Enterococcus ratti TaxID=150033 RepID=UPI003518DE09
MLDILSKKMKRQLLLLELLFEGETYRFQDLEHRLNCSSKTLRNDLMDIDSYAKEIKIHTDRENGIFAEIAPHVTEEYIYRIIMNEAIEYHFLESIVLNKYTNYLELAEKLFISESTLRRMVNRINFALKPYHLRIRGLIRLTGEKQMIEKLTIHLLLEKHVCLEEAFNKEICQKSRWLLSEYIRKNSFQEVTTALDHRKHKQLLFFIATKLYQLENEKLFKEKEHKKTLSVESNEKINFSSNKIDEENEKYLVNFLFEQPFIRSILKPEKNNRQKKSWLIEIACVLIDYLETKYQMVCEDRQEVLYKVMNDNDYMEKLSFILYDKHHQFLKQILPEIEVIQMGLKKELKNKHLENLVKRMKNDEFIRKLIALVLVCWPALLKKIEMSKQVRALIVTNSKEYANYIVENLELYLGGRYRFVVTHTPLVTEQMIHKEKYDCIVSNTMLTSQFNIPTFGISIYPKTREIQNLIFFYQQSKKTT